MENGEWRRLLIPLESAARMPARPIPSLSAVMPAYNEQEILPVTLTEAVEALDEIAEDWELIMVDDGSRDRTPGILADWSAKDPRIRVLTQNPNQGYSKALIRGFAAATRPAVFYTDADAQFDLREITRLYPHLANYDLVTGYRVGMIMPERMYPSDPTTIRAPF